MIHGKRGVRFLLGAGILSLMFFAVASSAFNVPAKIPVQGRLTNASTGEALTGSYTFTFRIYDALSGGTKLWEEDQTLAVDSGGLWSAYLGNNTPLDLDFSVDTYLEVEMNHDGEPLPRVRLSSVPYSKRSDVAANLSCVDCIGGTEINESTLSGVNASQLGGQASGYYLNTSTPFGGDVSGTYGALEVNASKIDTGTLSSSYIQDAYLLNTGDNATGNYTINGSVRVDNFTGSAILYVNASNGNVGIGTTSPTEMLTVNGNVSLNNTLYVLKNGNVGIGTSNPAAKLHINP